MNLKGYIKLHRKIMKWEWIDHPPTLCLFIHLLLKASYGQEQSNRGFLQPGQVEISRRSLVKETGLSEQQIKTALSHLQETGEIILTTQKGRVSSLVTIQNWSLYQVSPNEQPIFENPEAIEPQGRGQDQETESNPLSNPFSDPPIFQPILQPISPPINQPIFENPEALENKGQEDTEEKNQPISPPINQPILQPILQPALYKRNTKKDKNVKKNIYGEFVQLTDDEYQKLLTRFGKPFLDKCIDKLDNYIGSKGGNKFTKYRSHYHVIIGWVKDTIMEKYPGLIQPQQNANTTETQPEADPLAEWGGTL